MRSQPRRDWIVLLAISIAYCVAFLVEPDWDRQEAHLSCTGQPVQVFESMAACSVKLAPACQCARPQNPWVIAYWLTFLPGADIAAALLLRMQSPRGAVFLVGAMAAGGYGGLFLLSQSEMFEPEAWASAPFVIGAEAAITVAAFGVARLVRYFVVKRER